MKSVVANYERRVMCLRIVPKTGATIRIANHPVNLTMSNATVYLAGSGYDFTGYQASASFSPSAFDLKGIAGQAGIGLDQIQSGVFDNARCYLFATDWKTPVEDEEAIACSILGKATVKDDVYQIEEMGLIDALNQSIGDTYTAQCQKVFGSTTYAGCKKVPTTVTGTITSVTNLYTFRDSARAEADGFFTEGTIIFTSGNNNGLKKQEIKTYLVNGTITTHEPFYYPVQVGDTYSMVEGCLHTKAACIAKGNILNFGGFSFIPSTSQYSDRGLK